MLSLLDDRSFSGGVLDPALFAASEQVLASVFFTETADAYTALSNLDYSEHADAGHSPGHDDGKELILGAKVISFSTGSYSCNRPTLSISSLLPRTSYSSRGIWFLTRLPRIRLDPPLGWLVDLTQANSISFGGDELGIGSLIHWRSSRLICMEPNFPPFFGQCCHQQFENGNFRRCRFRPSVGCQ